MVTEPWAAIRLIDTIDNQRTRKMGLLVDGKWVDQWYDTESNDGKFKRTVTQYRNWITHDGSAGPSGEAGFKAEPMRYHLYVSLACPWAHRTLIFRAIKGLEDIISVSVVHPYMADQGWTFADDNDPELGDIEDQLNHKNYLHQIYTEQHPNYSGRVTVPVLWDKQQGCIVNNESAEIIRMLNSAFNALVSPSCAELDFYPLPIQSQVDDLNSQVYEHINNGVYRAGFATSQEAYDEAVTALFANLEQLEQRLNANRYLLGESITEADWRLFTTLIRFDPVYHGHFKCNIKMLKDYPNLWAYTRELYQYQGVADTVNMKHIKDHYYRSHDMINPTRVVPMGPGLDLLEPHGRDEAK